MATDGLQRGSGDGAGQAAAAARDAAAEPAAAGTQREVFVATVHDARILTHMLRAVQASEVRKEREPTADRGRARQRER
jgi:hypothetical protein